jgi:hypothetical protein
MTEAPIGLTPLTDDECWSLLATHPLQLGRIAFSDAGTTVVYPMNYAVAGRSVYLRTDPGSRLTAVRSRDVAFEVDHVDTAWERGWSVLARGHLREVVDPDELEAHRELQLRTWAPGTRLHLLCLDVSRITGRRID